MPSEIQVRTALEVINEHIGMARLWTQDMTFSSFSENRLVFYAVTRCLEIISEASRRVDDETRTRHLDVAWLAIRNAGNVYRHQYDDVLERRIFDTVRNSLDELEAAVAIELGLLGHS